MGIQEIVAALIVAACAGYIVWRWRQVWTGKASPCGACGHCGSDGSDRSDRSSETPSPPPTH